MVASCTVEALKKLNEFAPALTLLVVIAGFVWTAGRWSAQFEAVRQDVQELARTVGSVQADVRSLQADVRSVQETLPHMVSCMIDLQRFGGSPDSTPSVGDGRRQPPLPASCEHALARTTPVRSD